MRWIRALAYVAVATCFVAGCKDQSTGVHITVRSNGVLYDELRFLVTDVANPTKPVTLVDPGTAGRKIGLSSEPNPDVVVLLDDSLDGHEILCDVAALRDGQPTASGNAHLTALAHQIRDVEVFLVGAPDADAGAPADAAVDANHGGSGGRGGGSGGGSSGAGGGNGAGGSDGAGGAGSMGTGGGNGNGGSNGSGGNTGTGGMAGSNGSGGNTGVGGSGAGGANGSGGNTGAGGKAGTGALGSACTDGGQCASSYCADSVCCENACTGACTTCNFNKGQAGTCRPAMNHTVDPHHVCVDTGAGNCGTDGTCDNTGMCTNKFNTTCTPACASDTSRFTTGICGQTDCVGFGSVPCPANMSSCVAGICQ